MMFLDWGENEQLQKNHTLNCEPSCLRDAAKKEWKCKSARHGQSTSTEVNRRWTESKRKRQCLHLSLDLNVVHFAWTYVVWSIFEEIRPCPENKLNIFFYRWWRRWSWCDDSYDYDVMSYAMSHILVLRTNEPHADVRKGNDIKNLLLLCIL